jgi:hypothetical protein
MNGGRLRLITFMFFCKDGFTWGANGVHPSHGVAEAERLAVEALAALGVSGERKALD